MITIETNIPIPQSLRAPGVSKYPWEQMSIGHSFAILVSDLPSADYRPTPPDRLKRKGYRVQTRRIWENGRDVIRVWRIN